MRQKKKKKNSIRQKPALERSQGQPTVAKLIVVFIRWMDVDPPVNEEGTVKGGDSVCKKKHLQCSLTVKLTEIRYQNLLRSQRLDCHV